MENSELTKHIAQALRDVFGENVESGRFIDATKIPFICKDIEGIHRTLKEMKEELITKDQFWPVKTIVYSMVGIILTGVMGAILIMILK